MRHNAPIYQLYGEQQGWPTPDLIHCESIPERSSLHQWVIKPHRHNDLIQVLYMRAGRADANVDGVSYALQPPAMLLIPAMCIHGFSFSRDVDGHVLTLAEPLVQQLAARLEILQPLLQAPVYHPLGVEDEPEYLIAAIEHEYGHPAPERDYVLESLVGTLLVSLARRSMAATVGGELQRDRSSQHIARFSHLVDRHFKTHRPVDFYANELGVSAAHLNALCRRLTGRSALQIVHERLLLQAKRSLIYTAMTISEVSDSLGFSEPAYFSRFFKRYTGLAPKEFRRQG
jgi:AraC family transcriptional activator of pobA